MKRIKKYIEVTACELCGKELEKSQQRFKVIEPAMEGKVAVGTAAKYEFHLDCVEKLVVKAVKK